MLFATVVLIACLVFAIFSWSRHRRDWIFLVAVGSYLILIAWLRFDPGGFFEWWID